MRDLLDDAHRYACLEEGARYLASLAQNEVERHTHLRWANRYHRLKIEAAEPISVPLVAA